VRLRPNRAARVARAATVDPEQIENENDDDDEEDLF
jgi:hypothetical protein